MSQFTLHPQLENDSLFVRDLGLSQLRLQNQKTVPWLILVPRRTDTREIYQLSAEDRAVLVEEIAQASQALQQLYEPDKINVGALGNIVPQLHVHIIARFKTDTAWPAPVWGHVSPEFYPLPAIVDIKRKLNALAIWTNHPPNVNA